MFAAWWHEKLDSIYKNIKNDFAFLINYGFYYSCYEHHFVMPSVIFTNGIKRIQIGMNYEEKKMFVILYETKEQLCGNNLIEHIDVVGKQYKEQYPQIVSYLKNWFYSNNY